MALTFRTWRAAPVAAALTWSVVAVLMAPVGGAARAGAQAPVVREVGGTVRAPSDVAVAAPLTKRIRVVNHNIEKRPGALRRSLVAADRTGADVVTLQEVCRWQVLDLRRRHPGWTVSYQAQRSTDRCRRVDPSGDTLGVKRDVGNIAIWTGGPDGAVATHTFGPQRFDGDGAGLACVSWVTSVRHRACSVHLISPTAPEDVRVRTLQARDTRRIVAPWLRRDDLVVLGGDFNATPQRRTMRHLYAAAAGDFRESTGPRRGGPACRCARPTHDRRGVKIDYIFFSANRTSSRAPRELRVVKTVSDHHLLVGRADLDVSPR